jgi:hypothetical protein
LRLCVAGGRAMAGQSVFLLTGLTRSCNSPASTPWGFRPPASRRGATSTLHSMMIQHRWPWESPARRWC